MKQLYVSSKNRTAYQINRITRYLQRYTAFEIAATTIILLIGLWFMLSFIDIFSNNLTTNTYASWNIINILADKF